MSTSEELEELDYERRGHRIAKLERDCLYLLGVVDNWRLFKLPIPQGLDPTFYATLSYEGDLAIATRIETIRRMVVRN